MSNKLLSFIFCTIASISSPWKKESSFTSGKTAILPMSRAVFRPDSFKLSTTIAEYGFGSVRKTDLSPLNSKRARPRASTVLFSVLKRIAVIRFSVGPLAMCIQRGRIVSVISIMGSSLYFCICSGRILFSSEMRSFMLLCANNNPASTVCQVPLRELFFLFHLFAVRM